MAASWENGGGVGPSSDRKRKDYDGLSGRAHLASRRHARAKIGIWDFDRDPG